MFNSLALFITGFALVMTSAGDEKTIPSDTTMLQAKVLDVFENNRVLISFGKDHGAKKGQVVGVFHLKPQPSYGMVELLEIGAQNSIGIGLSKYPVQVNDQVIAFSPGQITDALIKMRRPETERMVSELQKQIELRRQETERMISEFQKRLEGIRSYQFGGAIIDLTLPKNAK